MPFDLFDEIPVSWRDIDAWVESVAGIPRSSWRYAYYVEHWNVPGKIRAAKLAGTFESIIEDPEPMPAYWHQVTERALELRRAIARSIDRTIS